MSAANTLPNAESCTVPDPLSLRVRRCPIGSFVAVIVDGPQGAVELQFRPHRLDLLDDIAVQYHSRTPTAAAPTPLSGCWVFGAAPCYPDHHSGGQTTFQSWLRDGDGQAVVDQLVAYHQSTWPPQEESALAAACQHPDPVAPTWD